MASGMGSRGRLRIAGAASTRRTGTGSCPWQLLRVEQLWIGSDQAINDYISSLHVLDHADRIRARTVKDVGPQNCSKVGTAHFVDLLQLSSMPAKVQQCMQHIAIRDGELIHQCFGVVDELGALFWEFSQLQPILVKRKSEQRFR